MIRMLNHIRMYIYLKVFIDNHCLTSTKLSHICFITFLFVDVPFRTALQMLATSGLSNVLHMQMCNTKVSCTTGCRSTMIQMTLAPSSVKLRIQALWWSWHPKCWMGHAVTPSPWTCASVESARWGKGP